VFLVYAGWYCKKKKESEIETTRSPLRYDLRDCSDAGLITRWGEQEIGSDMNLNNGELNIRNG